MMLSFLPIIGFSLSLIGVFASLLLKKEWLILIATIIFTSLSIGIKINEIKYWLYFFPTLALVFVWIFQWIFSIKYFKVKSLVLFVILNLSLLMTHLNSLQPHLSLLGTIYIIIFQLVYISFSRSDINQRAYDNIRIFFIIFLFFQSCLGILQFILGEPIGSISNYFGDSVSIAREAAQNHRSRGTFSYDTGYALFLILLIPFTLDLQKNDSIILKRFKNITLLVSIFALTFSFTRSCWLSFFITQSFIIIKNLKSKKKIFNLFILGIIAIPIAIFGGLAELIELRLFGDDSLNSSESRSVILASGLNVFFDNIYFGSGWSGFLSPDYFPSKDEVHIHNIFLLALIEFGLCGLFILIYIVKKLLFESRKYMNGRIKPEYISVVGGLIANLLDWSIMSPVSGAIFWALCGLLFNTSISKWENEIKKNNSHQKSDISAPLLLK